MAEPDVSDQADIEDVNLLDTDIAVAPPADAPAPAADEGTDDAAAAQDDAKPAADAKPDAADTTAKDKPADTGAKDAKADEAAAGEEGDQKPAEDQAAQDAKTPQQLRDEQQARARAEYQNRQRTRSQIAQQIDQNYGPKTEEDLIEEGVDPGEAKIEALRQEFAYKERRAEIAEMNAGMQAEAVNAENDFPIYRPLNPDGSKNPDFDPEFTKMVEDNYKIAARLQTQEVTDASGNKNEIIVNAEVPLYDFYKRMADIYSRGTSRGSQQGQAEMQAMMARTENPGGSSSTGSNNNSLEALEERLGDVVIT